MCQNQTGLAQFPISQRPGGAQWASNSMQDGVPRLFRKSCCATAVYPLVLFLLNAFVCVRLFRVEYLDQLKSAEGLFISLARYIQQHQPSSDWFPMWLGGMPFSYVYQPLLHYAVAAAAFLFHASTASAYHIVIAVTYSLGAVACYYLARNLCGDPAIGFAAGLLFSLFSPSLILHQAARVDAGGLWAARRLQALVVYGEGPNVTGLALCLAALALLHIAAVRRIAVTGFAAAVVLATVPATSWPATVALTLGMFCYLVALDYEELRASLPRLIGIGGLACGLALPFALPSTIATTFANANAMGDGLTPGVMRWICWGLLFACMALLRFASFLLRASFALRFALLYCLSTGWIVMIAVWFGIRMVPYPLRFHLAWEIGAVLAVCFGLRQICVQWPRARLVAGALLLVFCSIQLMHYRQYSRQIIRPVTISDTLEYQTARWFDQNMRGKRVVAGGTVSFWMNVFTETPQMGGCCEQSIINRQIATANYIIPAGYGSDEQAAAYSLLWMKAFAVHAIAMGGPLTREQYHAFPFPGRFQDRLPLLWQSGDDYIYEVPQRAEGLARVVRSADFVVRAPENGVDVAELRRFVAALDDPNLPLVRTSWRGSNLAIISGTLEPDQSLSVAINFHKGWYAAANHHEVTVRGDGLGLIVIEPGCSGPCEVQLSWHTGWEPPIALVIAFFTFAGGVLWAWRGTSAPRNGIRQLT